ncbi:MAG: DNA primase [Bdellovibrionaceae bacterium]|nr:DNA primase [Pseudobdellovibrionaceae bacterium]
MKFSTQFIERVSEANSIVDIIAQHTQLKSTGSGMMGRCPFPDHPEKTPSFSVSESKQVYHCFGCGKSGNIFTFLRDYQGLNFPDAVEYLANRAGISLPLPENANLGEENRLQDKKKQLLKVNKHAQTFFMESLEKTAADHPLRAYLTKRNLDSQILETFNIGYAPQEWDGLIEYLKARNIPLPLAEEAQLLKAKTSGGYYDLFKDRLMFPIQNAAGEVVAFGGRIIDQGQPKYLNSPESLVFNKGKILYGLPQTAKFIRTEDLAIVVEGYMDLVSLYQAGVKNVVAIMGTAFTADHAKQIKRLTQNVLVLLDGDQAGQMAAERALPILLAANLYPKGLELPEAQDPDDFVKTQGVVALNRLIKSAPDLVSVTIRAWLREYRGEASQKVKFSDQLRGLLSQISDLRLRELYVVEASQHLGVELDWLKRAVMNPPASRDFAGAVTSSPSMQVRPVLPPDESVPQGDTIKGVKTEDPVIFFIRGAPVLEKTALSLSLKSRANFDGFFAENGFDILTHQGIKDVLIFAKDVYGQDRNLFDRLLSQLVTRVDEPQALFYRDASTAFKERKEAQVAEAQAKKSGADITQAYEASRAAEENETRELRIVRDIVKRLREMALKAELKMVAQHLKLNPSVERLEQIKRIQIEISALNNTLNKIDETPDREI